jgi:thioredoxin 2
MADPVHIVCSHCFATNRIPVDKITAGGKCGKCHQTLLTGRPVELTQTSFSKFIGRTDLPVIVDFWAPWCGPCKMMAPVFEQAAQDLKTKFILAKVNTENEQALAGQYGIRSIPTLAIFSKGQELNRVAGAMDLNSLKQWANAQL